MICDEDKVTIPPSQAENAIEMSDSCAGNLTNNIACQRRFDE